MRPVHFEIHAADPERCASFYRDVFGWEIERIEAFERQVYVAQVARNGAGSLVEDGGAKAFGPRNLLLGEEGVLGNNTTNFVFPMGDAWKALPHSGNGDVDARNRFRE